MKMLVGIWVLVLWIDNILPFLLARFYPAYRHREMALSVLGCRQSPVKRIYNGWCILSGLVFMAAPAVICQTCGGVLSIAIWILLAVYGIGCEIVSGLCPLNEDRNETDRLTALHGGGSAIGFISLLAVPLLAAILHFRTGQMTLGTVSLISFAAAFVFFCFFIMGEKEKFAATVLRYGGLWQRAVLTACYIPLFAWCMQLMG